MKEPVLDTIFLAEQAERCEDTDDLRQVLRLYDQYYLRWQTFINQALDASGLSYTQLAKDCGISKNTLKKWCVSGGAPRSRPTYIKIGFGLGMEEKEINRLLVRYGGYHGLYAKDLFDAACIFTLQQGGTYGDAETLYRRCADEEPNGSEQMETIHLHQRLCGLTGPEQFLAFVQANQEWFTGRREKLCQYIRDFLHMRQWELANIEGHTFSLHAWAVEVGLPSRFEKILSNLYQHGIVPRREQLIALGLHLDMTPESLNIMLELANMERLCARNRLECVLIYALQKIDLLNPDLSFSNAQQLLQITQDPALRTSCQHVVREYLENNYHSSEEESVSVVETVAAILSDLNLEEAEELLELV